MTTFLMSSIYYETIFRPRRGHLQYKSGFIFLIQYSGIQYLSHGIEIEALIQLCAALTWPPLTPGADATPLPYWSTRTFCDLPSDLTVVPTYGNSCGIGAPNFRAIATVNSGRLKRIDGSGARVKGNEFAETLLWVLQKAILRWSSPDIEFTRLCTIW